TFTASVVGSGATPNGTVLFLDGPTQIGFSALDGTGVASFATSSLSAGSHSLTAVFAGSFGFTTSTSNAVSEIVAQAATSTALTATPNATTGGALATFTATVAAVAPGGGIPTGAVSFFDGTTPIAT